MWRYYSWDIEGKFWFAVQSSDDADFFWVIWTPPSIIEYYYSQDDLDGVQKGLKECEKELWQYKKMLDKFFEAHNGYNDEMIVNEFWISKEKVKDILVWYARYELWKKIELCIIENGECTFEAEC